MLNNSQNTFRCYKTVIVQARFSGNREYDNYGVVTIPPQQPVNGMAILGGFLNTIEDMIGYRMEWVIPEDEEKQYLCWYNDNYEDDDELWTQYSIGEYCYECIFKNMEDRNANYFFDNLEEEINYYSNLWIYFEETTHKIL